MKKILLIGLVILALTACTPKAKPIFSAQDASITVSGKKLTPGMDYTTPVLSSPVDYYEATSCAYVGMDKIYTYESIEVYTYPDGNIDYILEIDLLESGQTTRGIKIGATLSEIEAVYGTTHTSQGLNIVYSDGQISLIFMMVNDKATQIRLTYSPK